MKKLLKLTIIILLITISLSTIIFMQKENNLLKEETIEKNKLLTLMVEKDAGSGKYEKFNDKIPSTGYLLNTELSGCENGGKLLWNEEKGKIETSLLTSDKCYAFFDRDDIGSICRGKNLSTCFIQNFKKDGSIIYHDGTNKIGDTIVDAEDYSYRYSGASQSVNNYVCLDSSSEGKCNDNDLYRIIGLFKNNEDKYETKVIKNESIGLMQWHSSSNSEQENGHYTNEWEYSSLKSYLNNDFYTSLNDLIKGLIYKNHVWYIGGCSAGDTIPRQFFKYEIGIEEDPGSYVADPKVINANIGLMYASDYGFSASKNWWNTSLARYNQTKNDNWLYYSTSVNEWILPRRSHYTYTSWSIDPSGYVGYNGTYSSSITTKYNVRPVFYLSTDTILKSGNGSINSPFRIS